MALSRTARILVAILLLAAAAFFWVNFFTQNPPLADDGSDDPSAGAPQTTPPPAPASTDGDAEPGAAADASPDANGEAAMLEDEATLEDPALPAEEASAAETAPASTAPTIVVDAPVTLSRNVVVADLPFLVTAPPAALAETDEAEVAVSERSLAAARATVNPFSPVVVRVAEAPTRDVPVGTPTVTEVAVPAEPGSIPGPRVAAPAPEVRAPAGAPVRDLPRALPTGMPLAATPDLLIQARAPVERVDAAHVASIRLPVTEVTAPADTVAPPRVTTSVGSTLPDVLGPAEPAPQIAAATEPEPAPPVAGQAVRPPLAAGTNALSRFLRDGSYTFTGSALGPVSVGVFRSAASATPVVVAIGQTLPDTEIVLTDLRGQQAELTLGDMSQILVLDLRR